MEYILDAAFLGEKEEAHEYLMEMLEFPPHYGKNLDALHDCLTDIPELTLIISGHEYAGPYFEKLLPVMKDSCNVIFASGSMDPEEVQECDQ